MKSLYLHFPFCRHLCNYCDFYKKVPKTQSEIAAFQELLKHQRGQLKEVAADEGLKMGPWETLYLGGGTPSLWGEEGARFFREFLKDPDMALAENCEWTMEVNPGTWTREGLSAWQSLGVNRFSLGVQSLDSRFLKLLDRVHSLDEVYETLEQFKSMKVDYSLDFMLGLPRSQELGRDILAELDEMLSYAPSHLSLYILTTRKDYIHAAQLPDEDWIADEYLQVAQFLIERGFEHYEVSNFALSGKRSRHNMAYWKSESVAALGPSATGYLASSRKRFKWGPHHGVIQWEELTEEQEKIEFIYMSLRSAVGLKLETVRLWADEPHQVDRLVESWQDRGLVELRDGHFQANTRGFLQLDGLMDELFRYV